MKKLFTLLFSFGIISATFAQVHDHSSREQSGKYDSRSITGKANGHDVYGNDNRLYDDAFSRRELEAYKLRINREYDAKVRAVRNSRWLRASQKTRQIRMLEIERREQIRMINSRYSKSNNKYDDRYGKVDTRKW